MLTSLSTRTNNLPGIRSTANTEVMANVGKTDRWGLASVTEDEPKPRDEITGCFTNSVTSNTVPGPDLDEKMDKMNGGGLTHKVPLGGEIEREGESGRDRERGDDASTANKGHT